jgi:hypothetical protein
LPHAAPTAKTASATARSQRMRRIYH